MAKGAAGPPGPEVASHSVTVPSTAQISAKRSRLTGGAKRKSIIEGVRAPYSSSTNRAAAAAGTRLATTPSAPSPSAPRNDIANAGAEKQTSTASARAAAP